MHLILTLDYEIFGSGAGDVMRDMVRPTDRLLDVCERHGVKLTIMFEVGEYWAFERHDRDLRKDLGYSPCEAMRRQALDAVQRGHDVQLHLHPQWIGAEYDRGAWRLSHSHWRLADLPRGLGDVGDITSVIGALHAAKQTLESMVAPVVAGYRCTCFRAGGFYAQPSEHVIAAMKRTGLVADSSVVKGHRTDLPFEVDYSHAAVDKAAWWTTDTELTEEGMPGQNILELSVSSRMEPYWKNFKMTKLRTTIRRGRIEKASHARHGSDRAVRSVPSPWTIVRRLFGRHASAFDFCKLSSVDMIERMEESSGSAAQPIVVIGHSKDFFDDRELDRFLAQVQCDGRVVFQTMSQFVEAHLQSGYFGLQGTRAT